MSAINYQSGLPEDLVLTQPIDVSELMLAGPSWPSRFVAVRRAEFVAVQDRDLGRWLYRGRHHKPKGGTSK